MGDAVFSSCGLYRYRLERGEATDKTAAFVMVNPSTANAVDDDQTIRKVRAFANLAGARRVIVVNKFALRSKDIEQLRFADDPVGPENDAHIEQALRDADIHIVAWGPLAKLPPHLRDRWRAVARLATKVGCPLHCLGVAQDGHPRHPLMLAYASQLAPWVPS